MFAKMKVAKHLLFKNVKGNSECELEFPKSPDSGLSDRGSEGFTTLACGGMFCETGIFPPGVSPLIRMMDSGECTYVLTIYSTPGGTRTHSLRIRSPSLCPIELRGSDSRVRRLDGYGLQAEINRCMVPILSLLE